MQPNERFPRPSAIVGPASPEAGRSAAFPTTAHIYVYLYFTAEGKKSTNNFSHKKFKKMAALQVFFLSF
jgi:hypothetical protein